MASFLSNESVGGYLSQMSLSLCVVSGRTHAGPVCVAVMVGLTAMQSVQLLRDGTPQKAECTGGLPCSMRLEADLTTMGLVERA